MIGMQKKYIRAGLLLEFQRDPELQRGYFSRADVIDAFDSDDLREILYQSKDVDVALELFAEEGLLTAIHDPYAKPRYAVVHDAIQTLINDPHNDPNSELVKYKLLGPDWLAEVLGNIAEDENTPKQDIEVLASSIPASDRNVSIDHNSQEYLDTVAALDEVIQEFDNDHNLDNELGHEKSALLKALVAGRTLLEDTVINVVIGTALLMEPLKRIAAKYDQALVGALAATALGLVVKLLA